MTRYEFFAYSPDALSYNAQTGAFVLDAGYSAARDRNFVEISDDDRFFDGDRGNDEQGEDANQFGRVRDADGNLVASGNIYIEQVGVVQAPDGSYIALDRIEINGQHVGYLPSEPLQPGVQYAYLGGYDVDDDVDGNDTRASYDYYERNSVPSFGPGTKVTTQRGEIPVEWLDTSDRVLTRDNGFQDILWIGRSKLPKAYFDAHPEDAPVCIPAGAISPNTPGQDLCVTGDHRILIKSPKAEMMFFSSEVFAPAKAWVAAGLATQEKPPGDFVLTHILCAEHQIIMAQSAWVESMFTGAEVLDRLDPKSLSELRRLLGDEFEVSPTARPCLSKSEAAMLLSDVNGRPLVPERRYMTATA